MIVDRDYQLKDKEAEKVDMQAAPKRAGSDKEYSDQTPKYMARLKLSPEQEKRLLAEIKDEWDAIKKEREDAKLEQKWRALDNQYEGKVEEDSLRQFNLCRRVTKIKVDAVERLIMKAAWKADPKFSITARPEFEREGGREVCEAQEDFLDHKLDNDIPFIEPQRKTVHSSVVKGTGILKWFHELRREKRRREECYEPAWKLTRLPNGQVVRVNQGLIDFVKAYPNAEIDYKAFYNKLAAGNKIEIVVEYEETVFNDPMPTHIPLKDFYVRLSTQGADGLKDTRLIGERRNYNWWELKKKERQKKFYNIDELMYKSGETDSDKKDREKKANYANEKFDIMEFTYYFKLNENDEEETKIICWVAEERWLVVGAILYPYYAVPCPYNPHNIATIWEGFYQPSLAEYLTDNNIAENAILNFTLEGAMAANTVTPIADANNPVHAQFLDKRWTHGVPIETEGGKPIDFLNKYIGGFNHTQLLTLLEFLGRDDGDVSGVTQLLTGRESQLDPTAPARKTLALLQQSGINIEDYIDAISPSFARSADIILQLYYQMSEEGRKYAPRPERITGAQGNPFKTISRQDMIARTNIQSQAKAFNFDEANEKTEDLALYQTLRMEPIIARNPQAVYALLKTIIKGWSKKWKNHVEDLLPPLEQFQQEQQKLIAEGVAKFLQSKIQESVQAAEAAGQPMDQIQFREDPPVLVEQLMAMISDLTAESITNPPKEVVAERQKKQKEASVVA